MIQLRDPVDDALAGLRVSGSVLIERAHLRPWAIAVPSGQGLRAALGLSDDMHVVPFHLARRGGFQIDAGRQQQLRVSEGEAVFCPLGRAYRLFDGRASRVLQLEHVMAGARSRASTGKAGAFTELMCGVITMPAAPLNPLLAALPPMLRVSASDAAACPVLAGIVGLLMLELKQGRCSPFTTGRLLEAFFGEAIRAYRRTQANESSSWFAGLSDTRIARSIQLIHATPGHPWTVPELARRIGLSPSRYAARFRQRCGYSVMTYVSRIRLDAACQLLRGTDLSLSRVAEQVGYTSLPAFSRAFKALLGKPPTAWRAAQRPE